MHCDKKKESDYFCKWCILGFFNDRLKEMVITEDTVLIPFFPAVISKPDKSIEYMCTSQ